MRKSLSLTDPLICGYPKHAIPLSILSQYNSAFPWIICNYIQLKLRNNYIEEPKTDYFDFYTTGAIYARCLLDFERHSRESVYLWHGKDISKYFIDCIKMNYYVYTTINKYFVPNTSAYKKRFHPHGILIYGYDSYKKMYKIAGFNESENNPNKFRLYDLHYSELENAFNTIEVEENHNHYLNHINLIRYNNNTVFDFDITVVSDYLEDYLLSKNSYRRINMLYNPPGNYIFGISVYDGLKNVYSQDATTLLDVRPLYILWEHKRIMVKRLEYLLEKGYIGDSSVLENYHKVEKLSEININLLLKYRLTKNDQILLGLYRNFDLMRELEGELLTIVIREIKKY